MKSLIALVTSSVLVLAPLVGWGWAEQPIRSLACEAIIPAENAGFDSKAPVLIRTDLCETEPNLSRPAGAGRAVVPAIERDTIRARGEIPKSVLAQVAEPPKAPFVVNIVGPSAMKAGELGVFTVGDSTAVKFAWLCIPPTANFRVDTGSKLAYLSGGSGEAYTLVLVGIDGDNLALDAHPAVIGEGPGPIPPGPIPPGPIPPGPSGLRALILKEAAEPYDRETLAVLNSQELRKYLSSHVAKGPDNKTPEWRIWDDDYTADQMNFTAEAWRNLYEQAKKDSNGKRPWIILRDGARGISQALPKSETATLDLLKSIGGP